MACNPDAGARVRALEAYARLLRHFMLEMVNGHPEVILLPLLSGLLIVVVVPTGLRSFLGFTHTDLAGVMVTGLLASTLVTPSIITAFYTSIEASLEAIERYLLIPLPRYLVILSRVAVTGILASLCIVPLYVLVSVQGLSFGVITLLPLVYLASLATVMGVAGMALVFTQLAESIQSKSVIISMVGIVVSQVSPLLFPLAVLPPHLQLVMLVNPVTPSVELLRTLMQPGYSAVFSPAQLALLLLGDAVSWLALGLYLLELRIAGR